MPHVRKRPMRSKGVKGRGRPNARKPGEQGYGCRFAESTIRISSDLECTPSFA